MVLQEDKINLNTRNLKSWYIIVQNPLMSVSLDLINNISEAIYLTRKIISGFIKNLNIK